jgi:hypothetical protein
VVYKEPKEKGGIFKMFVAPGQEMTAGGAIAAIVVVVGLIMFFRFMLKAARIGDSVTDEMIRFQKNRLAEKNHRWKDR